MQQHCHSWLALAVTALAVAAPYRAVETRSTLGMRASYQLSPVWQVSVGKGGRQGTFYRFAACPDGSSFFTESTGRIVALDGDGHKTFEGTFEDARGTIAVACGADQRLMVANGREVVVFSREGSDGQELLPSGRASATGVTSLAATDDGVLGLGLLVPRHDGPRERVIWRLATPLLHGQRPEVLISLGEVTDAGTLALSHVLWDRHRSRIGLVPGNSYALHAFDCDGRPLGVTTRSDPSFQILQRPRFLAPPVPSDYVHSFLPISEGRYLAVVVRHEEIGPGRLTTRTSVEILDADLQVVGIVENGKEFGIPQAVSADGDIFSMGVTPSGSWVSRVRLGK